jgi:hypothetical protein
MVNPLLIAIFNSYFDITRGYCKPIEMNLGPRELDIEAEPKSKLKNWALDFSPSQGPHGFC